MNKKQPFRRTSKPRGRFPATHGAALMTYYDARHNDHSSPALACRFAGKSVYVNVILQGKAVEDYVTMLILSNHTIILNPSSYVIICEIVVYTPSSVCFDFYITKLVFL